MCATPVSPRSPLGCARPSTSPDPRPTPRPRAGPASGTCGSHTPQPLPAQPRRRLRSRTSSSLHSASCPSSATDTSTEINCVGELVTLHQLTFPVTTGTTYYLRIARVTSTSNTTGGTLTVTQQTPVPANNNCSSPTALVAGAAATNFTVLGATRDGSITAGTRGSPDIWYSYTAPAVTVGATITVGGAIAGASTSPTIGVFTACPTNINDTSTEVASVSASNVPGRQLTFAPIPNQTYLIRLARRIGGGTTTQATTGTVAITEFTPAFNDRCSGATPAFGGDNGANTSEAAVDDSVASTCAAPRDVWFYYDVPVGVVGITLQNVISSGGSTISVYSSCSGPEIACKRNSSPSICLPVVAGNRYYIRVTRPAFSSSAALTQTFTLRIIEATSFPANDTCANAPEVSEGAFNWSTAGACAEPSGCGTGPDVWFKYVPFATGVSRALVIGGATAAISRHTACGGPAVQCDTNPADAVTLIFHTTEGTPVYLRIAVTSGAIQSGTMFIDPLEAPLNDDCDRPLALNTGLTFFDTTDASDSGIVDGCNVGGRQDLWFSFTARSGTVTFNTCINGFTDNTGTTPPSQARSSALPTSRCFLPVMCRSGAPTRWTRTTTPAARPNPTSIRE